MRKLKKADLLKASFYYWNKYYCTFALAFANFFF